MPFYDDADTPAEHTVDCRITVTTTPEETKHIRRLSTEVISNSGDVNEVKLEELIRTCDLRAIPAFWRIIEAHPNRESQARRDAVAAVGRLAHLDSVPRLIRLLSDWGVYKEVYSQMIRLGLWGPDVTQWKPPPFSLPEVETVMKSLLLVFEDREPELREALHQKP